MVGDPFPFRKNIIEGALAHFVPLDSELKSWMTSDGKGFDVFRIEPRGDRDCKWFVGSAELLIQKQGFRLTTVEYNDDPLMDTMEVVWMKKDEQIVQRMTRRQLMTRFSLSVSARGFAAAIEQANLQKPDIEFRVVKNARTPKERTPTPRKKTPPPGRKISPPSVRMPPSSGRKTTAPSERTAPSSGRKTTMPGRKTMTPVKTTPLPRERTPTPIDGAFLPHLEMNYLPAEIARMKSILEAKCVFKFDENYLNSNVSTEIKDETEWDGFIVELFNRNLNRTDSYQVQIFDRPKTSQDAVRMLTLSRIVNTEGGKYYILHWWDDTVEELTEEQLALLVVSLDRNQGAERLKNRREKFEKKRREKQWPFETVRAPPPMMPAIPPMPHVEDVIADALNSPRLQRLEGGLANAQDRNVNKIFLDEPFRRLVRIMVDDIAGVESQAILQTAREVFYTVVMPQTIVTPVGLSQNAYAYLMLITEIYIRKVAIDAMIIANRAGRRSVKGGDLIAAHAIRFRDEKYYELDDVDRNERARLDILLKRAGGAAPRKRPVRAIVKRAMKRRGRVKLVAAQRKRAAAPISPKFEKHVPALNYPATLLRLFYKTYDDRRWIHEMVERGDVDYLLDDIERAFKRFKGDRDFTEEERANLKDKRTRVKMPSADEEWHGTETRLGEKSNLMRNNRVVRRYKDGEMWRDSPVGNANVRRTKHGVTPGALQNVRVIDDGENEKKLQISYNLFQMNKLISDPSVRRVFESGGAVRALSRGMDYIENPAYKAPAKPKSRPHKPPSIERADDYGVYMVTRILVTNFLSALLKRSLVEMLGKQRARIDYDHLRSALSALREELGKLNVNALAADGMKREKGIVVAEQGLVSFPALDYTVQRASSIRL